MLKHLAILSALAVGSVAVAHADPISISGAFSAVGENSFTSDTVTFGVAIVAGAVQGSFAGLIANPDPVVFLPGALPYMQGVNMPPLSEFPSGLVPIFTAEGTENFTFEMNQYNAGYIASGTGADGCNQGSTCLNITGTGFFEEIDPMTMAVIGESGPATFTFGSQYVSGQSQDPTMDTTFSASTAASPLPAVPEPASLALFGTGILGLVGVARRKFNV